MHCPCVLNWNNNYSCYWHVGQLFLKIKLPGFKTSVVFNTLSVRWSKALFKRKQNRTMKKPWCGTLELAQEEHLGQVQNPKNDLAMKTAPYNYGGSIRGTELTLQYKIDSCLNSRLRVTARRIVRSASWTTFLSVCHWLSQKTINNNSTKERCFDLWRLEIRSITIV